jgi:hypothetical protein
VPKQVTIFCQSIVITTAPHFISHFDEGDGLAKYARRWRNHDSQPVFSSYLQYHCLVGIQLFLNHTATLVLSSATWCQEILREMPLVPYEDQEVFLITKGQLKTLCNAFVPATLSKARP